MNAETDALALLDDRPLRFALSKLVSRLLPAIDVGRLRLMLPNGETVVRSGLHRGPEVSIDVKRWNALAQFAFGGDVGLAQAYFDDAWSTPDLTALFTFAMLNERRLSAPMAGSWFARNLGRLRHSSKRNSRRGSRRNIAAHYDLGNDFYAAWLDKGMNYSSAVFSDDAMSLEEAQNAKLEKIVNMLDLQGSEHVLEIGCGWGSLAARLVEAGCRVTGLTLSTEQLKFASELFDEGAEADIRLQDYRDVDGSFDRVVSIEMLEAVGEQYWPDYFAVLRNRMREGAIAVVQVITIAEDRFENYRGRPDFIQRCIFPGGMLPTKTHIRAHARRAEMTICSEESFGESYARTLTEWRARFTSAKDALAAIGIDERFFRLWDYYLAYCEVGFRTNATDVTLYKFSKA